MKPIFVAIDTADPDQAMKLAKSISSSAGGVKLGLEFFLANGPSGVREVSALGLPIFLDLKLHDIPNTVAKAMQALRPLEPAVVTVHAAGGRAMMEGAKAAAPENTKVVGVSVLTSLDEEDLRSTGISGDPAEQVARLAELARQSGLDGIVCSGEEVKAAKQAWPSGFFVVPGLRPQGSGTADQKRSVTPREALDRGASLLVIGRPITEADDPGAALKTIAATL